MRDVKFGGSGRKKQCCCLRKCVALETDTFCNSFQVCSHTHQITGPAADSDLEDITQLPVYIA